MKKFVISIAVAALAVPMFAQNAPQRFAVIDVQKVLTQSSAGKAAYDKLKKMQDDRVEKAKAMDDEIKKLDSDINTKKISLSDDKITDMQKQLADKQVALQRFLGDQEDTLIDRLDEAGLDEHAGQQDALRIGKTRAQGHRPGALIDHHLGKLDGPGETVIAAVLERQAHLRAARSNPASGDGALEREKIGARLLDVDIHRVGALDYRQRGGLAGGDERSDGRQRPTDAPADRGAVHVDVEDGQEDRHLRRALAEPPADDELADALREGRVVLGYALTFDEAGGTPDRCVLHPLAMCWVVVATGNHWVLDVAFREDDCRVRDGHAHSLAHVRRDARRSGHSDTRSAA